MAADWTLSSTDGELLLVTGVEGPAAKMGHRLTIAVDWQATVRWAGDSPAAMDLTADVAGLEVRGGEGGLTGLSGPEKALARMNAVKTLDAKRYPRIEFHADDVDATDGGYRLSGTLQVHGTTREHVVALRVEDLGDTWQMSCDTEVLHSDFGVKPYSLMMGALKVADPVTVSFRATRVKDGR